MRRRNGGKGERDNFKRWKQEEKKLSGGGGGGKWWNVSVVYGYRWRKRVGMKVEVKRKEVYAEKGE